MAQTRTPRRRLTKRSIILLALLASVIGGLGWDGSPLGSLAVRQALHFKFRDVRQVSPTELVAWIRQPDRPPPLIIDARAESSFALSRLEGAARLDPVHPDLSLFRHVARDQPLVVYDAAGVMGTAMCVALAEAGYSRVSNLDGGVFRWVNEGHPVVNDSGPARAVDPVSWTWGRLLKSRFHP